MKREEIEKAAKKYANENAYIPSDIYAENNMIEMKESFAEAFKEGVEWCIIACGMMQPKNLKEKRQSSYCFQKKITKWKQYIILMTLPMIVGRK